MKSPSFKFLPCIFCSIGFNFYVLIRRLIDPLLRLFVSSAINQEGESLELDQDKLKVESKKA